MKLFKRFFLIISFALIFPASLLFSESIRSLKWDNLSDRDISPQGKLAFNFDHHLKWDHAESAHFVYHFTDEKKKGSEVVYGSAEGYYQIIKNLFGVSRDEWNKKGHIFVFHDKADWATYCQRVGQTSQPIAFTSGWELYIHPEVEDENTVRVMAHELTHVIMFRFLDGPIPLFLNEGFADYVGFNALLKLKGYDPKQVETIGKIPADRFFSLDKLIEMERYPEDQAQIQTFYRESECLARYLISLYGGPKFYELVRQVSRGESFRRMIEKNYQLDFRAFESNFKQYALTGKLQKSAK